MQLSSLQPFSLSFYSSSSHSLFFYFICFPHTCQFLSSLSYELKKSPNFAPFLKLVTASSTTVLLYLSSFSPFFEIVHFTNSSSLPISNKKSNSSGNVVPILITFLSISYLSMHLTHVLNPVCCSTS